MTEFRQLMLARQKQLREEYEPLVEQRKALKTELDDVTQKLLRIKRELDEIERAERAIAGQEPEPQNTELTIKEAVLKVLETEKRGMTAMQILAAINERFFDGKIARTSLSPQLSRLNHADNKLKYDGTLWSLRTTNDEGPAHAEPSFLD